ncbi:hypothetical protein TWF281_011448 [Arthrobotrys megalospora]
MTHDWEKHKETLHRLYRAGMSYEEIRKHMTTSHRFEASINAYKGVFKHRWKWNKYKRGSTSGGCITKRKGKPKQQQQELSSILEEPQALPPSSVEETHGRGDDADLLKQASQSMESEEVVLKDPSNVLVPEEAPKDELHNRSTHPWLQWCTEYWKQLAERSQNAESLTNQTRSKNELDDLETSLEWLEEEIICKPPLDDHGKNPSGCLWRTPAPIDISCSCVKPLELGDIDPNLTLSTKLSHLESYSNIISVLSEERRYRYRKVMLRVLDVILRAMERGHIDDGGQLRPLPNTEVPADFAGLVGKILDRVERLHQAFIERPARQLFLLGKMILTLPILAFTCHTSPNFSTTRRISSLVSELLIESRKNWASHSRLNSQKEGITASDNACAISSESVAACWNQYIYLFLQSSLALYRCPRTGRLRNFSRVHITNIVSGWKLLGIKVLFREVPIIMIHEILSDHSLSSISTEAIFEDWLRELPKEFSVSTITQFARVTKMLADSYKRAGEGFRAPDRYRNFHNILLSLEPNLYSEAVGEEHTGMVISDFDAFCAETNIAALAATALDQHIHRFEVISRNGGSSGYKMRDLVGFSRVFELRLRGRQIGEFALGIIRLALLLIRLWNDASASLDDPEDYEALFVKTAKICDEEGHYNLAVKLLEIFIRTEEIGAMVPILAYSELFRLYRRRGTEASHLLDTLQVQINGLRESESKPWRYHKFAIVTSNYHEIQGDVSSATKVLRDALQRNIDERKEIPTSLVAGKFASELRYYTDTLFALVDLYNSARQPESGMQVFEWYLYNSIPKPPQKLEIGKQILAYRDQAGERPQQLSPLELLSNEPEIGIALFQLYSKVAYQFWLLGLYEESLSTTMAVWEAFDYEFKYIAWMADLAIVLLANKNISWMKKAHFADAFAKQGIPVLTDVRSIRGYPERVLHSAQYFKWGLVLVRVRQGLKKKIEDQNTTNDTPGAFEEFNKVRDIIRELRATLAQGNWVE